MVRKLEGILSTWRDRSKDELLTVFIMVEGKLVTKDGRRELEDTETGIALLALLDFLHKLESRWFRGQVLRLRRSNAYSLQVFGSQQVPESA